MVHWLVCGLFCLQCPGRGVPAAGSVASQDGGNFWQVELGSQRRAIRFLSCSPALDHRGECHPRRLPPGISELAFPQYLDGRHHPLY
jgi:hypothetical protein